MNSEAQQRLQDGLAVLGIDANVPQLMHYVELLVKWNKAYNLTAIRELNQMIDKHLLDSIAIGPYVHGQRIIDVGSGAGLPGIPLAIMFPEKEVTLLDSNGKKTRFLQTIKRELKLENVNVVHSRSESYHPKQRFDTVMSRAFASLDKMVQLSQDLLADNGVWLAMKGRVPTEEMNELSLPVTCIPYAVPGLDSERCIIEIKRQ